MLVWTDDDDLIQQPYGGSTMVNFKLQLKYIFSSFSFSCESQICFDVFCCVTCYNTFFVSFLKKTCFLYACLVDATIHEQRPFVVA